MMHDPKFVQWGQFFLQHLRAITHQTEEQFAETMKGRPAFPLRICEMWERGCLPDDAARYVVNWRNDPVLFTGIGRDAIEQLTHYKEPRQG